MTPPTVGAKAILNPISPMKNNANPVIIRVLYRLLSILWPSSPISRKPTDMVIVNTRRAATKTQRLFIRTVCIKITYAGELGRIILNLLLNCQLLFFLVWFRISSSRDMCGKHLYLKHPKVSMKSSVSHSLIIFNKENLGGMS